MSRTSAALHELEQVPPVDEGIQRLRVCDKSPLDVFVGLRRPEGTPVLQLELTGATVVSVDSFRSRGLAIDAQLIGKNSSDGIRYTLGLADPDSADLFVVLSDDLLGVVDDAGSQKAALAAFLGRLRHWSDFFSKRGLNGLTVEEQQGLFGEVWVVREKLAPYGAAESVKAWSGPNGANQDFQWHDGALEVKTTSANPSLVVTISNVKQLDDLSLKRISLVLLELDRIENGELTLPVLVHATRATLASQDAESAIVFMERVTAAGYLDAHEDQYSGAGYAVRRLRTFGVEGDFPRLTVADLPNGVGGVRYQIDVSALSPFETDSDVEFASFLEGRVNDGPE